MTISERIKLRRTNTRRTNVGKTDIKKNRTSGEKTYGHTGRRQEGGPPHLSRVQGSGRLTGQWRPWWSSPWRNYGGCHHPGICTGNIPCHWERITELTGDVSTHEQEPVGNLKDCDQIIVFAGHPLAAGRPSDSEVQPSPDEQGRGHAGSGSGQ